MNAWKLRCVFACDNTPIEFNCLLATIEEKKTIVSTGITEVTFGSVLMEQVLNADLFMNVFSEGMWGSLHSKFQVTRKSQIPGSLTVSSII